MASASESTPLNDTFLPENRPERQVLKPVLQGPPCFPGTGAHSGPAGTGLLKGHVRTDRPWGGGRAPAPQEGPRLYLHPRGVTQKGRHTVESWPQLGRAVGFLIHA